MRLRDRLPNYLKMQDITDLELRDEYRIYLDGPLYKAMNGNTGAVDFVGTVASTVINAAIAAITRGVVYLKTDVTMTAGITGKANVTLDCGNHVLTPATSFNMVIMKPGFQLRNFVFDVSGLAFTHACILFDGADSYTTLAPTSNKQTIVANGYARSAAQSGRFVYMQCDAAAHNVAFCTIRDVFTYYFEYAYYLESIQDILTCFINENVFDRIQGFGDAQFIYMVQTGTNNALDGNDFCNFMYQRQAGTVNAITCDGQGNYLQGRVFDIVGPQKALVFGANAIDNLIFFQNVTPAACTFGGSNNQVYLQDYHGFTGLADFYFFNQSGGNKSLYISGDVAGTDKYLTLNVSNAGTATIFSSAGYGLHFYSDTAVDVNRYASSNLRLFYGSGDNQNKFLQVFGRDAANANTRMINMRWGNHTDDMGIITTDNGDLQLAPATHVVRLGVTTNSGDVACNGYLTVKDEAGNAVKLMRCA